MKKDKNDLLNFITEDFLFKRFKLLLLNRFEWKGLDDYLIQERHLESYLFDYGKAILFEDKQLGVLCLPGDGIGAPNVYGDHLRYRVRGFNYSREVKASDCVIIENNKLRMPTYDAVLYFVSQLYDLKRTMDMNVKQLRLQTIFSATDKNVLTLKKIIDELEKFNHAIITDSSLNLEDIVKAVQTGVKPLTAELTDRYNAVLNEALTYFGINNANTDKRERLITDEVNSNNQLIDCCAEMFLEARQRACEDAKAKFGIQLSCELRNKNEEVLTSDKPTKQVTA